MLRFAPELPIPEFEIELEEVEFLDPDQLQGEQEKPPPPETAPPVLYPEPPPETPEGEGDEQGDETKDDEQESEEKARDLGKQRSKAEELGPPQSTFHALLVPKKIRKLSFREQAIDIMAAFPDFEFLVSKGGFDPLHDFDHIVIASSNIRDWRQTFLAVDYKMSREELKAGIERAVAANDEHIEWIEENGILRGNPVPLGEDPDVDQRWFVLLENKVAVYVLPDFLPHILADEVGEDPTAGNFVANLTKLRRFAARQPTAGLQVVVSNLRRSVKRTKGLAFQVPDRIELSAEAEEDPELIVRGTFDTAVDAKAFQQWWEGPVRETFQDIKLRYVVGWIYDVIEVERSGKEVRLWARFDRGQATMVLETLASQLNKMLGKTPEEVEADRRRRIENWKARQGGKLGPGAIDGGGSPSGDALPPPSVERAPSAGPADGGEPAEPPAL